MFTEEKVPDTTRPFLWSQANFYAIVRCHFKLLIHLATCTWLMTTSCSYVHINIGHAHKDCTYQNIKCLQWYTGNV